MTTQILLAGFGGQGLLFAGKCLAQAGLMQEMQVSWLPSYGPEMRGGTANCSVVLATDPIASPIVSHPDVLVAMNAPSYARFAPEVRAGGLLIADSAMLGDTPRRTAEGLQGCHHVPATELAATHNLKGLANMILLGCLLQPLPWLLPATIEAALRKIIPAKKADLLGLNLQAIALGRSLV